jgi:peptidoglycan biosynthesis protein MviN/MurJ (putative lipid II flippase)
MFGRIFKPQTTVRSSGSANLAFTVILSFLSFVKNWVVVIVLGVNAKSDVYYTATTLVNTPTNLITDTMNALVLPASQAMDKETRRGFMASYSLIVFMIMGSYMTFLLLGGTFLGSTLFPSFSRDQQANLTEYIVLLLPFMLLQPLIAIYVNALRGQHYFQFGNIGNLLGTVVSIGLIPVLFFLGFRGVLIANVTGIIVTALLILVVTIQFGLIGFPNQMREAFSVFRKGLPLLLGGGAAIAVAYIERSFASSHGTGVITILNLNYAMLGVLKQVFVGGAIAVFFPFISRNIREGQLDEVQRRLSQAKALLIGFGFTVLLVVLPATEFVLSLVYHRGGVEKRYVVELSRMLMLSAASVISNGLYNLSQFIFYSKNNTLYPVLNKVATYSVLYILIEWVLHPVMGAITFPFALSLVGTISIIIDGIIIRKAYGIDFLDPVERFVIVACFVVVSVLVLVNMTYLGPILGIFLFVLVFRRKYGSSLRALLATRRGPAEQASQSKTEETIMEGSDFHSPLQDRGNAAFFICLAVLALVPLLEAFRGIDVTDTGFLLTNQRFIFSDPARVSYWFHLWLTNILGGLVDLAFGRFGVLPHKLAAVVIFWISAFAVFSLYRRSMGRATIAVALAVSMVFAVAGKVFVVHYNNLSALLYLIGAAVLTAAVLRRKSWLYVLSGAVLALNVLVRIPNVIGLGLIFVPYLVRLVTGESRDGKGPGFKGFAFFALGAVLAAAAAYVALMALGHRQYYLDAVRQLVGGSTGDAGQYGMREVVVRPIRDTVYSLVFGLPIAAILAAVSAVGALFRQKIARLAVGFVVAVGVLAILYARYPSGNLNYLMVFRATAGLCYWAIIFVLFDRKTDGQMKLAAALSLCLSIAMNVGSDTGIYVSTFVFPAMFPAVLYATRRVADSFPSAARYRPMAALAMAVIALFAGLSLYMIKSAVYRDGAGFEATAHDPSLRGIFTSRARAAELDQVIPVIAGFAPPGSDLFVYDSLPLIHFATRTLPYLDNPWPALYSTAYMESLLQKKEGRGPLPVVVIAKSNPRARDWPEGHEPIPAGLQSVVDFVQRNHYSAKWQDQAFTIYVPPSR